MSSGCNFSDRSAYSEDGKDDSNSSPPLPLLPGEFEDGFESSLPSSGEYSGPFEGSPLEGGTDKRFIGKSNNDGDDMIDDSKSVGSFPSDDNTNVSREPYDMTLLLF